MHIPPFLRILLHHLPDSGYARCQYIYFLFGLLTMIFHSVRRVGFHLYMAVSTLQLTSIRIILNVSSFFPNIPTVSGVSSISTYYSLIQRWNPVLPLSPERHPYSSFNFQGSTIKSFCRYTFLYLLRFNAIISPVTANVNSTSCVLGSFLYSFLLIFCYLVL